MMEIKIISFGQIAEITGKEFMLEATDLDSLKLYLIQKFPELSDRKFAVAVNKKLVQENISLNQNVRIVLRKLSVKAQKFTHTLFYLRLQLSDFSFKF